MALRHVMGELSTVLRPAVLVAAVHSARLRHVNVDVRAVGVPCNHHHEVGARHRHLGTDRHEPREGEIRNAGPQLTGGDAPP
jgi:hypothetical protein